MSGLLLFVSCLTGLAAMAQAPSGVNLNIKTTISNSRPALNDAVSYTVVVTNTGTTTATNVVVKDSIPAPGLSGVTFTAPAGSNFASGTWSIGSVAPGASTALIVRGTVIGRGVFFSTAEIMSMSQTDDNSIPGNGNILEDDYSNACFSVPLLLYPADEYTVKPVLGSGTTVWYRNGVVISAGTVPTDSASVAVDGTLTIKSTGIYSFSSTLSGCAAGNCCNVEVIPGPYGSLGDYVWIDTNRNGKQDDGNTGLNGIKVYLYDAAGTKLDSTLTATRAGNAGFYTFNKLVDGQYKVKFSLPDSLLFSTSNAAGVTDDLNSDAGLDGFTKVYTIDTSLPAGNIGRDNPTVDAGLVKKAASLGDLVFIDNNKDGQQTPGEPGVPGVKVTLYSVPTSGSATPVASLTTDSDGKYLFTGLNPGNYYVVFDTTSFPTGFTLTTANVGNDASDSDAGKGGVTGVYSLSAGEVNLTVDAGLVPQGASLGDFVWYDNNKDGQQTPGEPGVPGVKVTLYSGTPGSTTATMVGSLTTNSSGNYLFTSLQPGTYYVVFDQTTLPAGYTLTTANIGSDLTDSDAGVGGVTGVYSLSAGEANLTVDAGIAPLGASLGDFVFVDNNKDGQQTSGEPGVPGVKVTLYSGTPGSTTATVVSSLTTDSNGKYLFTGLNPGSYYVVFDQTTLPAGFTLTTANVGDDATDSDAGAGGVTGVYSLSAGETNLTVDAGIVPQGASVGDFVFLDLNKDGQQTPGEPGVPGVKVTLYSVPTSGSATPVGSLTTDSMGKYLFTGLQPGNYYVVFDTTTFPAGTTLTTPLSGTDKALDSNAGKGGVTPTFSLSAGQTDLTIDAGIVPLGASLGDFVWYDNNKDGQQTSGEPGVAGVKVTLFTGTPGSATTTSVGSLTTNSMGNYLFTGLQPGNYYVVFDQTTLPAGYTLTTANIGSDLTDSDAGVGGVTGVYSLSAGEANLTVDAGIAPLGASLGDFVFVDNNKDGQQTSGEPGVPGVKVTLYSGTPGSTTATVVSSLTTDSNGKYLFTGLNPGSYYVVFDQTTLPAGFTLTTANVGDDATDSDAGAGGVTGVYSLSAGETNLTVDAGIVPQGASVGDFVFLDLNKDGQQTPGEPGVPGVKVTLYSVPTSGSATPVGSLTTDSMGKYLFTGLQPGNYYVVFDTTSLPAGTSLTTPLSGTDKALDSNAGKGGVTPTFSLSAGQTDLTIDAGIVPLGASLGDFVWYDNNKDGQQTSGEPGVAGVKVTLFTGTPGSATTTSVGSLTTNSMGNYLFTGLQPGNYYVVFDQTTLPAGYTLTTANIGSDLTDSDAGVGGITGVYSLSAGEANLTVDAGVVPLGASLGDFVFIDSNNDGQQTLGEPGVPGVKVTLYSVPTVGNATPVASLTTDSNGKYLFTGLTPGNYYVIFDQTTLPTGYTLTTANFGNDATDSDAGVGGVTGVYSLSAGETNLTVDAGIVPQGASVGDLVFNDTNNDGKQTPGEPGVPGVKVTLYLVPTAGSATPIGSLTTDSNGKYLFTSLQPGNYYVVFDTTSFPAGTVLTTPLSGTDKAVDSNAGKGGVTPTFSLSAGQTDLTIDGGIRNKCATPIDLTITSSMTICAMNSTALIGTTLTGSLIRWYQTMTGVDTLATRKSGQPFIVSPAMTTTYYADAISADGCVSVRKAVTVTVTPIPPAPTLIMTGGSSTTVCLDKTVDLTKMLGSLSNAQNVFVWYTTQERTGSPITNPTAVGPGKYYAFERTPNGCISNGTVITINGIDCNTCTNIATVNVSPAQPVCAGDTIRISATVGGSASSLVWSSKTGGTFGNLTTASTYYVPSATDIAKGSVELTATTNDPDGPCTPGTGSVLVTINVRPGAPTGVACDDTLICQGTMTKLIGFAAEAGAKINWYAGNSRTPFATTVSGGKVPVTPSATTTYYAEAVGPQGCVGKTRTPVTVTVQQCYADLAVVKTVLTAGPYTPGKRITYGITASNVGPRNATAVTVKDVLPASLTFVSATPAGLYDPSTGIWTIGALSAGSDRTLLMDVIVGAGDSNGNITNTAIIAGPDNDPKRTQNDTSRVTIKVEACQLAAPHITCAITEICLGDKTTLKAENCMGNIVWSDGQIGATVDVRPSATMTYSASCVVGRCVSPASNPITVTVRNPLRPTVTASAGTVCPGGSVTLTASGCAGQIQWSDPSLIGASVVVSPLTRTTYTAICKEGNCLSIPAVVTIEVGADLPKPTISVSTSVICPNETATLTITNCIGTPTWSTGDHTTSITVRPTTNTTYSVLCVNGACTSPRSNEVTIQVVAPAVPTVTVSSTQVCAGASVTLTASGCDGSVVWSNQKTGNSIVVNPMVSTTYQAFCKVRNCTGDGSAPVRVNVVAPAAPLVATSKALVCSGESVTLTATGCESGTVVWSNGLMGSTVIFMPTATADYSAVCQIGACKSDKSNTFRITVNTAAGAVPLITASKNYLCAGESITLSATGCAGTLLWSDGQQGTSIKVSPTATTEYYAICKLSANQCGSGRSNTVKINVTNLSKPLVTCSTDSICPGETVTLTIRDCLGTPKWSTGETTTSIVVAPTQTTSYSVVCKSGVCVSPNSDLYTIRVTKVLSPTVVASATEIDPGQSVTLTAQGCDIGTISWSNGDSGHTIVVTPNGTQSYYAQCKYRECLSLPSVTITIKQKGSCLAKAGSLLPVRPEVCSSSDSTQVIEATLNGGLSIPTGYSVIYVLTKGSDLVIQQVGAAPKFTIAGGQNATYTIHTLVYDGRPTSANYLDLSVVKLGTTTGADVANLITTKGLCADLDVAGAKTRFRYVPQPSVVSSATSVCAGSSVTLTVANCAGSVQWSTGDKGASIVTPIFKNTWISATCTVDGCTSSPSKGVNIAVVEPQIPLVSTDTPTICLGAQVTLKATGCENGTIIWSTGQTGSSIVVTPTATNNQFRAKCRYQGCESDFSPISTIIIGNPGAPTISVVGSTTGQTSATVCYGSSITLQAEGCPAGSYVTWSNNEVGNQLTVTPATSANYTARCCLSNNCKSEPSNGVALTVLPKVQNPTVTDRTNTCPFSTVDLTSAITSQPATTGGVFEFYTSNTPSAATKVANPNAVGAGTYYVFEKSTSGCYSLPSKVSVQIINCGPQNPCDVNPATASAGADDKICASKAYRLSGVVGGGTASSRWTTNGSGTFDNAYLPNATYTAGASDIGKTITMTLTAETGNKDCAKAVSTMKLTVDGVTTTPVAKAIGSTFACSGDSVTLEAKAAPQGTTYRWSNGATTQRITVATSGTYTVQYANAGLCLSLPSNAVSVSIAAPTPMPVVRNLRNICPATTVDLMAALEGSKVPGMHYQFHISPSCLAGYVLRPDSVGEGIYYVGARAANGCLSIGSKVVVSIFDCKTDTARVDLSVAKLANKTNVSQGETITYSLIVKNNGTSTATNVDMRDILPAGLELVAKPNPDYTLTNGVITVHYDSLAVGATDTTTFQARLTRKGQVVNKVELVYADQTDPNMANNTATVMVQDTSTTPSSGKVVVAKSVLNMPVMLTDSTFRVTYAFNMTNFGQQDATIQVSDNLSRVFSQHTVQSIKVSIPALSTLKPNAGYARPQVEQVQDSTGAPIDSTGNGPIVTVDVPTDSLISVAATGTTYNLLDPSSMVKAGATQRFYLTVVVKLNKADTTRTFANSAIATVMGGTTSTTMASINGADPNPNAQPAPTVFHLTPQGKQAQIGAALAVTDLTKLPDGSFNVTYQLILGNAGTAGLKGITAVTSLSTTFQSPVSFSLTGAPVGMGLVANPAFNGVTNLNLLKPTSTLPVGGTGVVTYTVNVMTGDNKGPFYSSVTAFAYSDQDSTQTTEDVSNTGFNPNPVGSKKTVVRFDLPDALVGVAKSVDKAVAVSEGRFDVTYTLRLTNYGLADLKHVQLEDNLTRTFEPKAMIVGKVTVTADSGLVVNSQYTGQGMLTQLLDTTSTLPKGKTRTVKLTVRVQLTNAGTDTTRTFYNTAIASGSSLSGMGASATSVSGSSSDPDNNGDPRDNNSPTPVVLNSLPAGSHIGVAMAVSDTTRMTDGSYKVTYKVVVKNYGTVNLSNISLTDSLAKVFNAQTGASFRMMGTPTVAARSSLSPNPAFDGSTVTSLLVPASSSLAAGKADTLTFTLNVATDGRGATYLNSVYARATANADTLRDVSTNGLNPDLNANGNPSDANESEATPLTLPATNLNVFIPQGFSPNGDGINDLFVIRGTNGLTVDLEVYNRWGNVVYKNADYKNDWDGRSNTNLNIGTSQGLPDGTYFYVVRLSNGMEYVRYLTINR